ncbi:MAG: GAF domain-containing protein, partial [Anaerolineae bacterium]|nr:GAF domain-containing protein [Anaerolineae bacterium]
NRDLELLNRASRAFNFTLDLDHVLVSVLEEIRQALEVTGCSAWLIDRQTDELVCRQAAGLGSETVKGWRLARREGIAGWVADQGTSLIVTDTQTDQRYLEGAGEQIQTGLRSILAVPLLAFARIRDDSPVSRPAQVDQKWENNRHVIGVLEMVDIQVGRFTEADLKLAELLASAATAAIENASLYEQALQDAETRKMLLREVNHRVKNNLTSIIGLLYARQRHTERTDRGGYEGMMSNLINQVQGLATVHSMLSAVEWAPLRLSELVAQVARGSLRALPPNKRLSINVSPSPVRVSAKQANSLALVINELVTNSVKYAMAERDTGCITIDIEQQDAGEQGTVLFEYRDDGPGYPEPVTAFKQHDVGLYLIEAIVRGDLRGELSLHNDCGAVTRIRFQAMA